MRCFICRTCGVQQAAASTPPERCPICEDERQYVGWQGQQWTTLEELRAEGYHSDVRPLEPDLFGIGTAPSLGIGQRALLIRGDGNVLWVCAGYLDQEAIDQVRELGGLAAISASHPHFYGCVVEWSQAFGGVPIYLPRADARWIMRRATSRARPSCTGPRALRVAEPCWSATPSRWCATAASSPSCAAIPT